MVMNVLQTPGITNICDSSKIPGEVLDLMVVNTAVMRDNPKLAEVLVGAWYEVMAVMGKRGPEADAAMTEMAKLSGTSLTEYKAQLKTTAMFWTPADAAAYAKGAEIKSKMDFVRKFCFAHGLLGENAKSVDAVGIQYPDGTVQGNKDNVRLRFDATVVEKASRGEVALK
jgi:NitT/TauT family transport system substrate-binding protein